MNIKHQAEAENRKNNLFLAQLVNHNELGLSVFSPDDNVEHGHLFT